jgi:hypothetical protein
MTGGVTGELLKAIKAQGPYEIYGNMEMEIYVCEEYLGPHPYAHSLDHVIIYATAM